MSVESTSTLQDSATPQDSPAAQAETPPAPASTPESTATPAGAQQNGAQQNGVQQSGEDENDAEKPKRGRPRKQSTARKTRSVELVLTVTGTMDGDWQAELKHGTDRVVQRLQVPASAVSRAAKELHDDISSAIEEVLGAAREQHRSRLEELEAEMAKVKQALAELEE